MIKKFDQHAINHMIVAINREMIPIGAKRCADTDTMFMGGSAPSRADQTALADFGLAKNYKIVFISFENTDSELNLIGIHAVVTDGLTESIVLPNGRLWKRDRHSAAAILFPDMQMKVQLNSKGRLVVKAMSAQHHDHGYDLARDAVLARAGRKPGKVPVIASIGSLMTVVDIQSMADSYANAE